MRSPGLGAGLLSLVLLLPVSVAHRPPQDEAKASANEVALTVDPGQSKVHWTLGTTLHTVHGTFALKRGAVRVDRVSGNASGEIVADATSGLSGNDSRDKKMHKEVLESARYTEVVFRPDHIEGQVPATGAASVQIHGLFALHGSEHELTVPVEAQLSCDHWSGTAKFRVPYIGWGLKNPSTFLLKTDPTVEIELNLKGAVQAPCVAASR
jgi:polyisoprenoid-binding protein YceI